MSSVLTKESLQVSITRPSTIKFSSLSEPNNPYRHHQSDGNSGFLRAARAGNLEKVLEYLRSSIDINTSNANGLNALHLASKEGHVNIVQELLTRAANVNATTKKGNTALHIASLAGQEEVVKLLVKYNANINCQSQNGFSPLYMAAQENHIEVVKFLLANGANQSLATEDGFTPLAVSLQQGHENVVAILLENDSKGSKVRLPALHIAAKKNDTKAAALLLQGDNQPDLNYKSGFTPLHIAAHYGNLEVAQLLISRGADVNYAASQNIAPLHVASKWGKENIVRLLLEKGAQIDVKTKDGLTPLHCAARSGHDQVVDLLLENGAPFGAKTKNGLSALHMAAQGDHVDAARILLYYKSTLVDDVSSDYLSPLHVASHCGNYNVAKLLCERRADVNAKALNGFSCLHIACKKNRLKLVELLISSGADVEAKTESGLTCLHVASFVGSHDIVVYLLQHGANINAITIRGETPLHLATRNNQVEIVQTLLRQGASVDMKAKEAQTCLHLGTRLGNIEIVNLLLKATANVDNITQDGYSSLHIAAKEGHEEIASLLIDHGANLNLYTKRNFTALHICSKYGNIKVANLLLQKGAKPDCQGKNDLTPLHCAVHYNHSNIVLLLLQHAASPHVTARNGYTPLHIAAKKNTHDIAEMLLEYNANTNAQSSGGFTPLHLSCQDGHSDMTHLLLAHHADPNLASKCHLTPLHLCAQEDRVKCAEALVDKNAIVDAPTLSGYTSLHVACHFGQINMVRFLLQHGADANIETNLMFTPLHSAAQQGHVMIVKLLLEQGALPNKTNKHGMTALSIAQRLGYISVVEELKIVTETTVSSKHESSTEERYKIQAPEVSHEEHPLSDSEDEGDMLGDASSNVHMQYLRDGVLMTEAEENKLHQTSLIRDECEYPILATKDGWIESRDNLHDHEQTPVKIQQSYTADNEVITRPRHGGFLVSFLVDARGGAMRGCRHSGVRVIIPAKRASMPTRITCRFVKRDKLTVPPPLNEGEALAARVLEVGPVNCKFLGPVILEIPHFASLRNHEREIIVLRSDNGEKWTEHASPTTDDAVRDILGDTVDTEELENLEELHSRRITRIITNDFPRFFALITRSRQEAIFIDEQGGLLTSTIIPKVQAHVPEKALQKRIRISLHVLPIPSQLIQRSYGTRVNVSPIVTVEPRRRKFHKPITLTIPLPTKATPPTKQAHHRETQQQAAAYTSDSQTLRLLCSITGGTHPAQFDDITGHTPLTFSNDCATFTTTVSARFWLIDAQGVSDVLKLAHDVYREATSVPYMSRFVVFAKRNDPNESLVRVFCITDDKENKTLEMQEHFIEIAKSKEVEVINGNTIYLDLQSNNLQAIVKTNEQLTFTFRAFRENRLPCIVRIRDYQQDATGRLIFSKDNGRLTAMSRRVSITMTNGNNLPSNSMIDPQLLQAICNLNIVLPTYDRDSLENEERLRALHATDRDFRLDSWKSDDMYRKGEIRLTDIARLLGADWPVLAAELELTEEEVTKLMDEHGENAALHMLRYWLKSRGRDATGKVLLRTHLRHTSGCQSIRKDTVTVGANRVHFYVEHMNHHRNCLQQALRKIGKENIVHNCVFNIEWVTDAAEKEVAKARLSSRGGSMEGTVVGGRRLDEGFESDDEYERRRHGRSNLIINDSSRTGTIIKSITLEETNEDELGENKLDKLSSQQNVTPQFKQLEPLKMVKRDISKEFLPSSSSTSSADTIINTRIHDKRIGERDAPLHYVDTSKAPTPASRYGGYYSIYNPQTYSGSITPLSCYSHPFEMIHLESLREKLNRLTRDKVDHDDSLTKQRSTDIGEGRKTPTDYGTRKYIPKRDDFGIVNIAKETTPIDFDSYIPSKKTSSIVETIIQETYVPPVKVDLNKLEEVLHQQAQQSVTITTVEQIAPVLDEIPPTRAISSSQPVSTVGERLTKSKIIPEQARALAHALKHAVVKPLKKSMATKKSKSVDTNTNEQQLTQPLLNTPSSVIDNSDNLINEISADSLESASPTALTPPPTKPPRHNDESPSSSSIEISSPPTKPPRHFSLYSNAEDDGLIQQTDNAVKKVLNLVDTFGIIPDNDNDMNILRQISQPSPPTVHIQQLSSVNELDDENLNNITETINTFTVDPKRVILNTESPVITKTIDEPLTINSSSPMPSPSNDHVLSSIDESTEMISNDNFTPIEITQLANSLTDDIFGDVEKEFIKQDKLKNLSTIINNDRQDLLEKLGTESGTINNTFRDNSPTLLQSIATTHPAPTQSTTRPLMLVSLDSDFNIAKTITPLLDLMTTKQAPKITTNVTVISPAQPELSSVLATNTNTNSDDEDHLNSSSTLMPNSSIASDRSKFLQSSSKESSVDSNDTNLSDIAVLQQLNTGCATPARSLLSDYDNLHGSYGSLDDDTQQPSAFPTTSSEFIPTIPITTTTSLSTIDESIDSLTSSSTISNKLRTDITTGAESVAQSANSYISDEDLVESYDVETPILAFANPLHLSKASPPIIEVVEDNSEPTDEYDMSFLNDVLEQYNHNLHHQDPHETNISGSEPISTDVNKEVTIAGKGEEPSPLPSSLPQPSSLLISPTSPSTNISSFSSSHMTTKKESNISPSTTSQSNDILLKKSTSHEEKSILSEQHHRNDSDINIETPTHQRRLPLPNKLTFEQNITNLLENESPLLQSELLTAEHELSVLRSRLAVNEGVTAVTGSILQSLKGQFEPRHKVDIATSPFDISKVNLFQHSLASQTSPMIEASPDIPESVEIHYDAQTPKSPYLLVKTKNSYWIAQPIPMSEAQTHLNKFSSPVMKRATVKLPKAFDQAFLTDSDTDDEQMLTSRRLQENKQDLSRKPIEEVKLSSIIEQSTNENQLDRQAAIDDKLSTSEIKTIRSSSLLPIEDRFEKFDDKIDEIYSIIDYLKTTKLTSTNFNTISTKINDLKTIISDIDLNKQDELRIEYELDELQNLFHTIDDNLSNHLHQQEDYSLIDLFEQNVNELRRIINAIKCKQSDGLIAKRTSESETKTNEISSAISPKRAIPTDIDWTPEQMAEYFQRGPDGQLLSPKSYSHLIPEDPIITREVFFEGDKSIQEKKVPHAYVAPLVPEDARISANSFYEGDPNRWLFHKEKTKETSIYDKPLIPESPLISSDVFYEGDSHRSMFVERSSLPSAQSARPASSGINNLHGIMSDLMHAASLSITPLKQDEEVLAESFITTQENYPSSSSSKCEILHEIEKFPVSSTQLLSGSTTELEESDTISPFSSQTPIFIHRTILTRQETERWPQDESMVIEESASEETVKTDELEKSTNAVGQETENLRYSSDPTQQTAEEQVRPGIDSSKETSQIPEKQFVTDDFQHDEASKQTDEYQDQLILKTPPEDLEQRDENEPYQIERTWSTEKIIEPTTITIATDNEAQALYKELVSSLHEKEHALESQNIIVDSSDAHHIEEPVQLQYHPETITLQNENQVEDKPKTEYNDQLEEVLHWEELIPDSTQFKDDAQEEEDHFNQYEQSLSSQQTPSDETQQPELSSDKENTEYSALSAHPKHLPEHDEYEHKYATEQYHPEFLLSSNVINIEHITTSEHDRHEPMLVSQQQEHAASPVIESTYKQEGEEGPGETHILDEKIQQKLTATEIHLESPHESDHEDDEEEEPYQSEEKLISDQITIESPHFTEQEQHELSSSFDAASIPSHEVIEQVAVESAVAWKRESNEEEYEKRYESDQDAPEYRTTAEVIKTEFTTQDEEEHFDASVTPQQKLLESPLVKTTPTDEQDDYYDSREASAADSSIVERSATAEEYSHQSSVEKKETDELQVAHEFEILQKSNATEIQLESPHESDHEKEDQYNPESTLSSDAIKIEHTETVEQDPYEPMLVSQQQEHVGSHVIESHYTRDDEEGPGETHILDEEIQQKLTATEIHLESPNETDHEEDQEEAPSQSEQMLSSDQITLESSHITEQDQHELSSSLDAASISTHQVTEQRLNTEQVSVESVVARKRESDEEEYEESYESDQDAPEYRTTAEV
ncbi:unnamed protein product, partial [Rotaria socialis]